LNFLFVIFLGKNSNEYFFNSQSVHLKDGNLKIFVNEAMTCLREGSKDFESPAAYGGGVGFKGFFVAVDELKEIAHYHVTVELENAVLAFDDFVFYLVGLVSDFADYLLENIFHRDKTGNAAVFVGYYCKVAL